MKKYTEQVFENNKHDMTVGELKKIINNLDDNMRIGGTGNHGEYLECFSVNVREVFLSKSEWLSGKNGKKEKILSFSIENSGEEPN